MLWDDIVWFGKYSRSCPATGSWRQEWTASPLATVVTQQTMRAGKQCQDCSLEVLIEHLHIFSLVKLFEFDLPPQVDVGPPRVDLE